MRVPSTAQNTSSHPGPTEPKTGAGRISGCPTWWDPHALPPQVVAVRNFLLTFMSPEAYEKAPVPGALLWGPASRGKTSAALALGWIWGAGRHVAFRDFTELMIEIRSSWTSARGGRSTADILEELYKPRLLILDDLGKKGSPEDSEIASALINGRINRGIPTVCTTNHTLGTPAGQAAFNAVVDGRVLARYTDLDVDCAKRAPKDLRQGQGSRSANPSPHKESQ